LYYEGGNSFHLTNKNGIPQFIFGDETSVITHQLSRIRKWFNKLDNENLDVGAKETMIYPSWMKNLNARKIA